MSLPGNAVRNAVRDVGLFVGVIGTIAVGCASHPSGNPPPSCPTGTSAPSASTSPVACVPGSTASASAGPETWEGEYHDVGVEPSCYTGPAPITHAGHFTARVNGDQVDAQGTIGVEKSPCNQSFPPPYTGPIPIRKTDEGFLYPGQYGGSDIVVKRSGCHAEGTKQQPSGDVTFTITVKMDMTHCPS